MSLASGDPSVGFFFFFTRLKDLFIFIVLEFDLRK